MSRPGGSADKAAQDMVEGRAPSPSANERKPENEMPSAGPHADPALVNPDATPGAGALPSPGEDDGLDSTSG
jgi:hypothetical protein